MRYLTRARDEILQRRYAPRGHRSVRTACLWPRDAGGQLQVLQAHADRSKTPSGRAYNRRIRLVRRFGLSAFVRRG